MQVKSLKLCGHSLGSNGVRYETVKNRRRNDLQVPLKPLWLQVITEWRGRGGIHSRIIADDGEVPDESKKGYNGM